MSFDRLSAWQKTQWVLASVIAIAGLLETANAATPTNILVSGSGSAYNYNFYYPIPSGSFTWPDTYVSTGGCYAGISKSVGDNWISIYASTSSSARGGHASA
ncbi:MAG: hypothetical protein WCI73_15005, partial [Phycisphaerae bacterium]